MSRGAWQSERARLAIRRGLRSPVMYRLTDAGAALLAAVAPGSAVNA
jgi:hypothetical protein